MFSKQCTKETWKTLTTDEKFTSVKKSLDEVETYVLAAKEYIKSSKNAVCVLRDIIAMTEVDIKTAEACILESDRKINQLKFQITLNCRNSCTEDEIEVVEESSKCENFNKTLDGNTSNHILDMIPIYLSKESDFNLDNYEIIKCNKYENTCIAIMQSKLDTKSNLACEKEDAVEKYDSLDKHNTSNSEFDHDSLDHLSTDSDSTNLSQSMCNIRNTNNFKRKENRDFYSENNKTEYSLNNFRSKNLSEMYICDEDDIQSEKSIEPFNKTEVLKHDNCSGYSEHASDATEKINNVQCSLVHGPVENDLEMVRKSSLSNEECLVTNFSCDGMDGLIDSIINSNLLLEYKSKLLNIINAKELILDKNESKINCKVNKDFEDEMVKFSCTPNNSDLNSNFDFKDEKLIPIVLDHRKICDDCNKCDNTDDSLEKQYSNGKNFIDVENPNLEISTSTYSTHSLDMQDNSYVTVSANSDGSTCADTVKETSNADTSVYDNISDISVVHDDEKSMHISNTQNDFSDEFKPESSDDTSISVNGSFSSTDEHGLYSYQVYATDSSNYDCLSDSFSDFSHVPIVFDVSALSQDDDLDYISFKEGVSMFSLNSSLESPEEETLESFTNVKANEVKVINIDSNVLKNNQSSESNKFEIKLNSKSSPQWSDLKDSTENTSDNSSISCSTPSQKNPLLKDSVSEVNTLETSIQDNKTENKTINRLE